MDRQRFLDLLTKKLGRNISRQEEAELNHILNTDSESSFFTTLLDLIQSDKKAYGSIGEEDLLEDNWETIEDALYEENDHGLIDRQKGEKRNWMLGRWAAVWIGLLLCAGLGWSIVSSLSSEKEMPKIVPGTPNGIEQFADKMPQQVTLPDQSVVWLNSQSTLEYAKDFGESSRIVYLKGEAYFDVAQVANKPFVVHVGEVEIQALGTSFNVEAYQEREQVNTTLISGKIKVQLRGNPDKSFILKPKEKLSISTKSRHKTELEGEALEKKVEEFKFEMSTSREMSTSPEISWVDDKLKFEDEEFEVLSQRIERRYGVKFDFLDEDLKHERMTGEFKNENIQKVLKIIQMTTNFKYRIRGDTVFLQK